MSDWVEDNSVNYLPPPNGLPSQPSQGIPQMGAQSNSLWGADGQPQQAPNFAMQAEADVQREQNAAKRADLLGKFQTNDKKLADQQQKLLDNLNTFDPNTTGGGKPSEGIKAGLASLFFGHNVGSQMLSFYQQNRLARQTAATQRQNNIKDQLTLLNQMRKDGGDNYLKAATEYGKAFGDYLGDRKDLEAQWDKQQVEERRQHSAHLMDANRVAQTQLANIRAQFARETMPQRKALLAQQANNLASQIDYRNKMLSVMMPEIQARTGLANMQASQMPARTMAGYEGATGNAIPEFDEQMQGMGMPSQLSFVKPPPPVEAGQPASSKPQAVAPPATLGNAGGVSAHTNANTETGTKNTAPHLTPKAQAAADAIKGSTAMHQAQAAKTNEETQGLHMKNVRKMNAVLGAAGVPEAPPEGWTPENTMAQFHAGKITAEQKNTIAKYMRAQEAKQ